MKKTISSQNAMLFKNGCRKLWDVSSQYFVVILLLSLTSGMLSPFSAIIWQHILDSLSFMLQSGKWTNSILLLLLAFSGLNLLSFLLAELLRYFKQTYSNMVGVKITTYILKKSSVFPMEVYDDPSVYDHLHIALDESGQACLSLLDIISSTTRAVIQVVAFVVIVIQLNWIIAVLCVLSSFPLLYLNMKMGEYWHDIFVQRAGTTRFVQYLKMLLTKNENVKEAKLYKLSDRLIGFITTTYCQFLQSDKEARKQCLYKTGAVGALDELASWTVKAIIVFLGIMSGSSIGHISLYFNSQNSLKGSVMLLFEQISTLHSCLLTLQSLDIIEQLEVVSKNESEGSLSFPKYFKVIEFRNVTFRYPNSTKDVIKDLSFRFENGKTYSIVGLNGAGKTTLIKLLLRLYQPSEGEILIDGENIEKIELAEYYDHVSAVFQDFLKLPFSLYENVTCKDKNPDSAQFLEVAEIADISQMVQSLPQKENTPMMKEWTGGVDISHGQWQRVAIARCCYANSPISILDEPFSSIDAKTEAQIIDRIANYRKGRLTIYITHQFTSISLADQILVIKGGQLIESGTHQELIDNKGLYFDLYSTQLKKLIKDKIEEVVHS